MVAPAKNPDCTQASIPDATPSFSDRDSRLVAALVNPSPEGDTLLAACDPAEHPDWLDRPEIQRALAAAQAIRDLRLRAKAAQRAERAMDRLSAVLDHASDLKDDAQRTETRRAASVLARISTQCLAWADRPAPSPCHPVTSSPRHSPSPSHRITVSPSQPSPPHPLTPSPPHPQDLPRLVNYAPGPTIAGILARLRALSDPRPQDAFESLKSVVAFSVKGLPSEVDRFTDELAASPAFTARHRPTRAEPLRTEGRAATQRIVFTLEDGREAACTVTLTSQAASFTDMNGPRIWLITSIRADDSG